MRIRTLGTFEVEGVAFRDLGSRKGRLLLKVLVVAAGTPVSVDRIAEILWGGAQPSRPADQVGVLVSRLRSALGTARISRTDGGFVLFPDWVDVVELRDLTASSERALAEGRVSAARTAAAAALRLVRGEFLPDEDGEWVRSDRAAVAATVRAGRRLAIEAAEAAGDHSGVTAVGEQALAHDPYDEVVLRALMSAHLVAGRPAAALAAYGRVRAHLAEDLGVPPTAATEALYGRALAAADGDTVIISPAPGPPSLPDRRQEGLVGRSVEMTSLDESLAEVGSSGGALVVVEGEIGIGKTTLVDAWSRRAARDCVVLRGRCDELGRDLPLQPVADALADHLETLGHQEATRLLGEHGGALAPLLGPVAAFGATVVADAGAGVARLYSALAAVIDKAGGERPTVLVVEDLHAASDGTRSWLAYAQRRSRRTLIVATTRPGGAKGLVGRRVRLGVLDRSAVEELVGPDRAAALLGRSGGHPLVLSALDTALMADSDEVWPRTVGEAIASRIDSLGDDVASTLRVAAVVGPECDLELLAQIVARSAVEALSHLEAAAQAGLLVERSGRFEFRHQLIREGLEATTSASRRALLHLAAARVLARRPDPDPLSVARHARAGGDLVLASDAFVAASAASAARFDLRAADAHLEAAMTLAATPQAFTSRARLNISRRAFDAAAGDAKRAISLGGGASALEAAGWAAYYQRRYEEARAYADEAAARGDDPAVRASARALAGRVRHAVGDLAGAVEYLTGVEGAPPPVRGIAEVWLGQVRVHQGRPADALAVLARPMVDADRLAHPWAPLHLRFNRVLALGQLGRVAEARRVVVELEEAVHREGAVGARFAAPTANAASWILRWSGRLEEAEAQNLHALEATGGKGGPSSDALAEAHYVALLDLADGCLLGDDPDGAAELCDRLAPIDAWDGTMAWHQRHRLGLLRARLALVDGDRVVAAALASAVLADAEERGAGRYAVLARAVIALADGSIPDESLGAVVNGVGSCAVLDGWPLVAALASARRADPLKREAERLAGLVLSNSGEDRASVERFPILSGLAGM